MISKLVQKSTFFYSPTYQAVFFMSVVKNISYLKSVYALKFIDLKAIKATKNSSFSIKTNCLTTINYEKDGKIIRLRF